MSLEARNKETLSTLAEKEALLEKKEQQLQELMQKMSQQQEKSITNAVESASIKSVEHDDLYNQLAEKDKLLQDQQAQLEELKSQWEAERAELIKPALEQVTAQLEELKQTVSSVLNAYNLDTMLMGSFYTEQSCSGEINRERKWAGRTSLSIEQKRPKAKTITVERRRASKKAEPTYNGFGERSFIDSTTRWIESAAWGESKVKKQPPKTLALVLKIFLL